MRSSLLLAVAASALALAACGGETPNPETPPAPTAEPVASAVPSAEPVAAAPTAAPTAPPLDAPPPPAKKSAKELVEAGGTFAFSLADSADAKKAADDACAKKAKKDAKKLEACQKDAADSAANEGIRFESKDGKLWFTSFGTEKGKEVVYLKTAMKFGKEDGAKVVYMPDGKAEGKMAPKGKDKGPAEVQFEVDESTVKMTDPMGKKGVLVYKKK
jgi:type IV secretory pathway VirB10-like protein